MTEDVKKVATSDDIRDALANRLLRMVEDGVKVRVEDDDGKSRVEEVDPPAAYLTVVVAYLKNNPPATQPSAQSPTGVLKKHLSAVKPLPFPGAAAAGANKE